MTDATKRGPAQPTQDGWLHPLTLRSTSEGDEPSVKGPRGAVGKSVQPEWDEKYVSEAYSEQSWPPGRPPKCWLVKTKRLVNAGNNKGHDHLRRPYKGGMFDHLLSTEMKALGKALRAESSQWKRRQLANRINLDGAGDRGRATRSSERQTDCARVINGYWEAYRGQVPSALLPAATKVAKWYLAASTPNLRGAARARAVRALTRRLRRSGLAS
jgi:hypothetical protein